jgi:hypothetical protein
MEIHKTIAQRIRKLESNARSSHYGAFRRMNKTFAKLHLSIFDEKTSPATPPALSSGMPFRRHVSISVRA